MSHQIARYLGAALLTLILAVLAGCGGGDAEAVIPVEGKVIFKNQPLTKGNVAFIPDTTKGNNSKNEPRGQIDADGKYKLVTHPREGAAPGWYKVAVTVKESSDPKNPYAMQKDLIPEKYAKAETSGLKVEVRKDAPAGAYDLEFAK